MRVGYHASHEQFAPADLLRWVAHAERAGFEAAMCSDHLAPWLTTQGHAGSTWSWLGAALQATGLSFGTVSAPGDRYHPAILAQAVGTLAEMYPGRAWLALGSGERLNEHVTGAPWPARDERRERTRECAEVMRRLLAGEEVTHEGRVRVHAARLWVRPSPPPPLYAAALSEPAAEWAAGWADGVIIAPNDADAARPLIEAYRGAGGRGPVLVQHVVSYAATEDEALRALRERWPIVALEGDPLADLATPEAFEAATAALSSEAVAGSALHSADLGAHLEALRAFAALDIDAVYVHNVGADQDAFIEAYGREVLPALRD